MSKGAKGINIEAELETLAKEELKLFHSYNRHGTSDFKLKVLYDIQKVIIKQDALKALK